MDCGKTRSMIAAYHDGELAPADRARVEAHLRGCARCTGILSRLAAIDAGVDVPDPGPEYWERFNRRVMERVEGEAAPAKAGRPKRGWMRRGLPYFVPVAAAAALLVVVLRQTGPDPFSRTAPAPPVATGAPPTVIPPASPQGIPEMPAPAQDRRLSEAVPPVAAPPAAPPPSVRRKEPEAEGRFSAPDEVGERLASGEAAAEMKSAGAAETEKADRALSKTMAAAAPAAVPPPCEEARSLAGRGRLEEAESAQRACLARDPPPEARESGMVFLAELLDRQSRIAEADTVLEEARRRFPASRPLDSYLRQRSQVQGRRLPAGR